MSRLLRRWLPRPAAAGLRAWRGAPALGVMAVVLAAGPLMSGPNQPSPGPLWPSAVPALAVPVGPGPPAGATSARPSPASTGPDGRGPGWQQIILPDLAVIEPHGLSVADIRKLGKIRGARDVLAVDGAAIEVGGRRVNVIGVDPQQFRSWTPLRHRLRHEAVGGHRRRRLRLGGQRAPSAAAAQRHPVPAGGRLPRHPDLRRRGYVRHLRRRPGRQQQRLGRARAHPQRGRPDQRARGGDAGPQA